MMNQVYQQPNNMPPPSQYQQPIPQPVMQPAQPGVTILYTANGTPVQVANVNPQEGVLANYRASPAKALGALQIFAAIVIIICQIVVTVIPSSGYEGFVGFWAPVIFILAGAFGVQSSKSKSRCTVIATMVLSIVAAIFSTGVISTGAVGASLVKECRWLGVDHHEWDDFECGNDINDRARTATAFFYIMLIFGILEGIVAIIAACFCCQGCCCQRTQGVIISQGVSVTQGSVQMAAVQYQNNPGFYPAPVAPVPMASFPDNNAPPAYQVKQ